MTGETITDPAVLADQLEHIRATGIATEVEEAVLGECAAAAPVFDASEEADGCGRPGGPGRPAGRWIPKRSTRCAIPRAPSPASWARRSGRRGVITERS